MAVSVISGPQNASKTLDLNGNRSVYCTLSNIKGTQLTQLSSPPNYFIAFILNCYSVT